MTTHCPKCRPILFKAEMVRALLDGTKTQTRRIIKPQPPEDTAPIIGPELYSPAVEDRDGNLGPGPEVYGIYDADGEWGVKCPLGQPGDRLWVREAWAVTAACDEYPPRDMTPAAHGRCIEYKVRPDWVFECGERGRWRPSIFMPRWASRITLEITDVRVERVQEISVPDCIAEGTEHDATADELAMILATGDGDDRHKERFADLWDSINAKRGFSWESNPWVFAYTFRRLPAEETT